MAIKTLQENVNQAINDLCEIRQALINKGVECPSGTPTCEYGAKIEGIQSGGGTAETYLKRVIDRTIYTIKLPEGLTEIGMYAFQRCESLYSVEFPSSLSFINQLGFNYCTNLRSVTLPKNFDTLSTGGFKNCSSLTTVTFLGTPLSISSDAFGNCTNLKKIRVPWYSGKVANAPWGATNATIVYNYKG